MPDEFKYDVFLSHSSKDKQVLRLLSGQVSLLALGMETGGNNE